MKKVVVVGMGTVGKSLSLTLAQNSFHVSVVSRRGQDGFRDLIMYVENEAKEGRTKKSREEILSNLSLFSDFKMAPSVEIVIETIKENLMEKQQLFQKLDMVYHPNIILASVTSSLSITEICKLKRRPDRMIGLHFFNPVPIMNLVEVVPGKKTSVQTLNSAMNFVSDIGKIPMIIPDQPGFLVNRLLFVMINEAINVLAEGRISAEDIDRAMGLGTNQPMGPLHIADFVGLDTCLTILENLYEKTNDNKYKPPRLLISKVKNNELGRKSGKGFFDYLSAKSK